MTPEELSEAIALALEETISSGQLTLVEGAELPAVRVERPKSREHGDWATNVALQLAKKVGKNPREAAALLAEKISAIPGVASVDIAGPGFLNITLDAAAAGELAATIVEAGEAYGRSDKFAGKTITLSSSPRTPPAPSTWVAPAGLPSVMRSPASLRLRALTSCVNTTSTTTAPRLTVSCAP